MIQLQNISAGYGKKTVIRNISLDIQPGKILALLGPNGSGKSTLLKTALGLLPLSGGQILYDDRDICRLSRKQIAQKASFLTQNRNVPSIQALKMVLHGRFPYLSYPRQYTADDYILARQAMETAGCADFAHEDVSRLSGGQRQAVYLAMTLAQDTQTVFMDEPTTYLDLPHQASIFRTARELADRGKAVVLVLHDLISALGHADKIAVLDQGNLVFQGAPDEFLVSTIPETVFHIALHCSDTPHGRQYYYVQRED